jgi:hypothetical protein
MILDVASAELIERAAIQDIATSPAISDTPAGRDLRRIRHPFFDPRCNLTIDRTHNRVVGFVNQKINHAKT